MCGTGKKVKHWGRSAALNPIRSGNNSNEMNNWQGTESDPHYYSNYTTEGSKNSPDVDKIICTTPDVYQNIYRFSVQEVVLRVCTLSTVMVFARSYRVHIPRIVKYFLNKRSINTNVFNTMLGAIFLQSRLYGPLFYSKDSQQRYLNISRQAAHPEI